MVFLFPTRMILPFCRKSKDDLLRKIKLNDDISGIIEKDDIHHLNFRAFFQSGIYLLQKNLILELFRN